MLQGQERAHAQREPSSKPPSPRGLTHASQRSTFNLKTNAVGLLSLLILYLSHLVTPLQFLPNPFPALFIASVSVYAANVQERKNTQLPER